ncbi:MAG: hypothetical protein SVO96_04015 [Pseudomonadota bacterium]|nr:hypothetical protein [Pseudomonadota bacterium]
MASASPCTSPKARWCTKVPCWLKFDPRSFQIQLQQAQAQLARDQALRTNAQQDLTRHEQLIKEDSIAQQQVSTKQAPVRRYQAASRAIKPSLAMHDGQWTTPGSLR